MRETHADDGATGSVTRDHGLAGIQLLIDFGNHQKGRVRLAESISLPQPLLVPVDKGGMQQSGNRIVLPHLQWLNRKRLLSCHAAHGLAHGFSG